MSTFNLAFVFEPVPATMVATIVCDTGDSGLPVPEGAIVQAATTYFFEGISAGSCKTTRHLMNQVARKLEETFGFKTVVVPANAIAFIGAQDMMTSQDEDGEPFFDAPE